jgi:hypothetical protein
LKKEARFFDADFSLFNCAGGQCVFDTFEPAVRNGLKAELAFISQRSATNLLLDLLQAAVGQLSVFRLERTTKLLAASLTKA